MKYEAAMGRKGMGRILLLADARQKKVKRINAIIKDIQRDCYNGIGKPEPLKENLAGWWSRRIDDVNRIVYREKEGAVIIAACKGHYDM